MATAIYHELKCEIVEQADGTGQVRVDIVGPVRKQGKTPQSSFSDGGNLASSGELRARSHRRLRLSAPDGSSEESSERSLHAAHRSRADNEEVTVYEESVSIAKGALRA